MNNQSLSISIAHRTKEKEVDFFEKLILRKQVCEVTCLDVGNDRLASEVDAIVHVAVQLEGASMPRIRQKRNTRTKTIS